MPRGTDYKPEYCELLIKHMEAGLSFVSFGGVVRCSKQTLFDWVEANPDFAAAKELGETLSQLWWETQGMDGVWNMSGEGARNLNNTHWIFNMKNRFKWRDKHPDENDTIINNTNNQSVSTEVDKAKLEELKQELLSLVKK